MRGTFEATTGNDREDARRRSNDSAAGMARPGRLELPTSCSAGKRSIRAELRARRSVTENGLNSTTTPVQGQARRSVRIDRWPLYRWLRIQVRPRLQSASPPHGTTPPFMVVPSSSPRYVYSVSSHSAGGIHGCRKICFQSYCHVGRISKCASARSTARYLMSRASTRSRQSSMSP